MGRTGKNILHKLIPLLRQSIYSRLAGYDDTNDADRLSQDPAMRVVVGWKGPDRKAASTSEMSSKMVLSTVKIGPPDLTKSRTLMLRFRLAR